MTEEHPNVSLLKQFDIQNLDASADLIAQDAVFHFFNPKMPQAQGDYVGLAGIRTFFETMAAQTQGTFKVEPIAATAVGDELVVAQTRNTMTFQGKPAAIDVVVVWRFVDGRIAEVWDIPSVYTLAKTN